MFQITYQGGSGHDVVITRALAPLSVTPDAVSTAYDGSTLNNTAYSDTTSNYSITGFLNGQTIASAAITLSGSMAFNGSTSTIVRNAGGYALSVGMLTLGSNGDNYSLSFSNGAPNDYVITPAVLDIYATSDSRTYDGKTSSSAAPTFQVANEPQNTLYDTDTISGLAQAFDSKDVLGAGNSVLRVQAGYTISDGNGGNNYNVATQTAVGTIISAPLSISATGTTKVYGFADPTFTYTVGGDGLASGDSFTGALSRASGENVGSYAITLGNLAISDGNGGNNYNRTFNSANFTITARPISVTAASGQTKVYGFADPTFTYTVGGDGLATGDSFTGALGRVSGKNVGSYGITQGTLAISDGNSGNNYSLAYNGANFTITARPISVTADAKAKLFGAPDPALSYQITSGSLAGSDTLSGTLTRVAGEAVGTYAIQQGSLTAGSNYDLTYIGANLTITLFNGSVYVLSASTNGALTVSGNAVINIPGNLVVDSNSASAILASGNAKITVGTGATVQVGAGGGVSKSGNASVPSWTATAPIGDPLSLTNVPNPGGTAAAVNVSGNNTMTIGPGLYSSINVSGNGKLIMGSGVYYIQGGGFTVSGNASVDGSSGVLIYNTVNGSSNGGITLSGNGTISLNPRYTTGQYANVLIFQPMANTRALTISGNAMLGITGIVYAPTALANVSGNGQLGSSGSPISLIASTFNVSGNVALTQMAAGSDGSGDSVGIADTLLAGNLDVYINNSNDGFTSDMLARIDDAISGIDTLLVPYNVTITEVSDPSLATVVIDTGTTSASGTAAEGVLGCFNPTVTPTEITLLQGWNWYTGADPAGIGADQYDFQTTVTHEFGHALGLGGSQSTDSPMNETLPTGTARRTMSVDDLNVPYPPEGADPQMAAGLNSTDDLASPPQPEHSVAPAPAAVAALGTAGLMALPAVGGQWSASSSQWWVVSSQWSGNSGQPSLASASVSSQAGSEPALVTQPIDEHDDNGHLVEQTTTGEFSGSLLDDVTTEPAAPAAHQEAASADDLGASRSWHTAGGAMTPSHQPNGQSQVAGARPSGQTGLGLLVKLEGTTRGSDRAIVRTNARARFMDGSILDDLALDPAMAIRHSAAGPAAVSTVPSTADTASPAGQAGALFDNRRIAPIQPDFNSSPDSSRKAERTGSPLLDLVLAAGFCGFGAGIMGASKRPGQMPTARR